jgi:SAM-dependent methyltransferase
MNDIDTEYWQTIAQSDPYWAVLTADKFKGKELTPDTETEFYSSGIEYINYVAQHLRRLSPDFSPRRAIDFGCGVGRLALAMRSIAEEVLGLDISPPMLAIAQQQAEKRQVGNITFSTTLPDNEYDWINSFIVFQHIHPDRGLEMLQRLIGSLSTRSAISLHFTIYRDGRVTSVPGNPFGRFDGREFSSFDSRLGFGMQMYDYDLGQVVFILHQAGFSEILMHHTDHGGSHGVVIFGHRQ